MAESSRTVKKRKDGSKIVTKTNKKGATVRRVIKKDADGNRTAKTTRTRTNKAGAQVRKKADGTKVIQKTNKAGVKVRTTKAANGTKTVQRKKADGSTTARSYSKKGNVTALKKKNAEGKKKSFVKGTKKVARINDRRKEKKMWTAD